MQKGTTFGLSTEVEADMAALITKLVPSIEKIRFVSSGTEATMSAARLARGYTKRDLIVKFSGNYHGHSDMFLVQAGSGMMGLTPTSTSAGIPNDIVKNTVCLPYNDIQAVEEYLLSPENNKKIAAVILEPIAGNMGCVPATKSFIEMLRKITSQIGALLIFDEVITGFRIGLQGSQAFFNTTADLVCYGKIIGGGFPAAAFGGKKEIMDCLAPMGSVYQAGTLSGNPVAMESGKKALELVSKSGFYEDLQRKTDRLLNPVKALIGTRGINACVQHVGSMFTLFFGKKEVHSMKDAQELDFATFSQFFKYLLENGVYFSPAQQEACFISSAHTNDELDYTSDLICRFWNN